MAKKGRWLVLVIWFINAIGVVLFAGLGFTVWANHTPRQTFQTANNIPAAPVHKAAHASPFPVATITPPVATQPAAPQVQAASATNLLPSFKQIGFSVQGRPLEVFQFGSGPVKRVIIAGIHGGYEKNTIWLADQLIAHINQHPDIIPDHVTLFILRNMNPDGEARAHGIHGRLNDRGVDLNRNFPDRWKSEWKRTGCWNFLPVSAGAYPASEPETNAVMMFLKIQQPDALISYHSAALGIFAGGVPDYQPSIDLAKALAAVSRYQYPPIDTGCEYTGNLTDWAASTRGIAAVDIELSNHHDTEFEQNLKILEVFLNWQE